MENDIVDIDSLRFEGVEFPADAAVICLFSAGWRKGFFFDLTPLGPEAPPRGYDIEKVLGSYYAYVMNQSMFALDSNAWDRLIEQQWFPFVSLSKALIKKLAAFARAGQDIDQLLPEVSGEVTAMVAGMVSRWESSPVCASHIDLLRHAATKYTEGDFISATAILYPRIEGLLRTVHASTGVSSKPTQTVLSGALIEPTSDWLHDRSWLLPGMFRRYLEEAYFAAFRPGSLNKLSRHSVAHGVADSSDFDEKAACLGLLIVDQLYWLLPPPAA